MKRADIETGKVYGYSEDRAHIYRYSPVVILSTASYIRSRFGERRLEAAPKPGERLNKGGWRTHTATVGLLAVQLYRTDTVSLAKVAWLATVEDALRAHNGEREGSRDVRDPDDPDVCLGVYMLVTNSGDLHGDYFELARKIEESERQAVRLSQEVEQERNAALARYRALGARTGNLGVVLTPVSDYEHPSSVRLSFEQLEKLLSLAESAVRANQQAGIHAGGLEFKDI